MASKTVIRPWKRSIVFKIVQVLVTFMSFVAISSVLPVAVSRPLAGHLGEFYRASSVQWS